MALFVVFAVVFFSGPDHETCQTAQGSKAEEQTFFFSTSYLQMSTPHAFKFPGWKSSLRGWKYFAAVKCGMYSAQYFPEGHRSFFLVCLEALPGVSRPDTEKGEKDTETSWLSNNGAVLVSRL